MWRQNGTSVFTGPGLDDYTSSILQLDLSDGFLTSNAESPYSMLAYLRPLPNTVLEVDFELHCTEECSLSLKKVSCGLSCMLPEILRSFIGISDCRPASFGSYYLYDHF
ncbi:unnamed protein product [Dibothriocephalus latus]|uniref:Uncharacterized protein n=1 Tax=Dibothriocephalus latus TaxID=60516 RepID=A0A3P7LNH1_DIBLA|nr:unnamed protein product [Dibothriocephalus latus]